MKENINTLQTLAKSINTSQCQTTKIIDVEKGDMGLTPDILTARVVSHTPCQYLDKGDLVMIDPKRKRLWESGIFLFEYEGHVLIRQFQISHQIKKRGYVRAVATGFDDEEYQKDKIAVIGEVIGKYRAIFQCQKNVRYA